MRGMDCDGHPGHRPSPTVSADASGVQPLAGYKTWPRVLGAYCCSGLGHTHLCGSLPSHLRFCSLLELLGTPSQTKDLD